MKKELSKELKEKVAFMEEINKAMQTINTNVENVRLDVFEVPAYSNPNITYFEEYLVVTFKGGAISCRNCAANSNMANLEEFTKLMFGGYYSEVEYYKLLKGREVKNVE